MYVSAFLFGHDTDIIKQLRSSDLHALPASSALSAIFKTMPSAKQYPHVKHGASSSVQEIAESLARRCGSTWTSVSPATGPLDLAENSKHVVYVNMPVMEGSLKYRRTAMLGYGAFILDRIIISTSHTIRQINTSLAR